jgi:hypothetical protein
MTGWLNQLHTLVPDEDLKSARSNRSDSHPIGPNGAIGPGMDRGIDMSKALSIDDVVWLPRLNRWVGPTSPRLSKKWEKQ